MTNSDKKYNSFKYGVAGGFGGAIGVLFIALVDDASELTFAAGTLGGFIGGFLGFWMRRASRRTD